MRIERLRLKDFRGYSGLDLEFRPGITVLQGENAQGKTNLLEAVGFLSRAKAFRASKDAELVRFGSEAAHIKADIFAFGRAQTIEAGIPARGRKRVLLNGVAQKSASGLSGVFRTVLFAPEDLLLLRDGAAARRRFLDNIFCQLRPRYASALSEYQRALERKTRILRDADGAPGLLNMLEEYNERLAQFGAAIISYRARLCAPLLERAAETHRDISGGRENFSARYKTDRYVEDPFASEGEIARRLLLHLSERRRAEMDARMCLIGPHKDEVEVFIDEKPVRAFGSQGQTRTAALALKLSERELHVADGGERPVLLLDDVLSELDTERRAYVLSRITDGQVIITTCENAGAFENAAYYSVINGQIVIQ